MTVWVVRTTGDDNGAPTGAMIHGYKKLKRPTKSRAMTRTYCKISIDWKASLVNNGHSFAPGFAPTKEDNVCHLCKGKAS